jgi:membrane protease YdiL (CAAX protease family)
MRRLYSAQNALEAQELRLFLGAHGIRSEVCGDNSPLETGFSFTPASAPSIYVAEQDLETAEALIQQYRTKAPTAVARSRWTCSQCGRKIEAQFDACWGCENLRDDATIVELPAIAADDHSLPDSATDGMSIESAQPAQPSGGPADRSEMWLEVGVVLSVAWLPYFVLSLLSWLTPTSATDWPYAVDTLWSIASTIPSNVVVLYLIYRSSSPWHEFGIKQPRLFFDFGAGVIFWMLAVSVGAFVYSLFVISIGGDDIQNFFDTTYEFAAPIYGVDYTLHVLFAVNIGFTEELAMRGYLIPRLEKLLVSTTLSIGISSALFASYHLYQGVGPMLQIFVIGLVFGITFVLTRRLWPVVIAHAIMDVVAGLAT